MSYEYLAQCHCTKVKATIKLPEPIENFVSRACDCDFCQQHKIEYLSHPKAILKIDTSSTLKRQKQGSNQADFLSCPDCHKVIAVSHQTNKRIIGALNATLLQDFSKIKSTVIVSPRKLSAKEKVERWQKMWLTII